MIPEGKIFAYCERGLDPGFLAEPLNAITNGAFILAGLAAWVLLRRLPAAERGFGAHGLVLLMLAIGVGSFLFHTYATRWAVMADVIPIWLFMLLYFALAMRRLLGLPVWGSGLLTLAFVVALWAGGQVRCGAEGITFNGPGGACLNGSAGYLPAFFALVGIGAVLAFLRHPATPVLLAAGGVFAVSLALRTLDRAVCDATVLGSAPLGTHFLWHLLNALTLYLLTRAVILHGRPRRLPEPAR